MKQQELQPHQELDAIWREQLRLEKFYEDKMRELFPPNCRVRVNHHRGSYPAYVVGYDARSHRLRVRNAYTDKISQPYPGMTVGPDDEPCVERVDAALSQSHPIDQAIAGKGEL